MASQQEEEEAQIGNYETLTRSFEASFDDGSIHGDEYQNLSDAYSNKTQRAYLDVSFSGSFDDPTPFLDVHPNTTSDQPTDTISRRSVLVLVSTYIKPAAK